MPVRIVEPDRPADYATLLDALASEWSRPEPDATEPVIIEQRNPPGNTIHVHVIWSRWGDLDQIDRSEIIMDAAERVKSEDEVNAITQAWGLTPDEADRLKPNWRG